MLKMEDVAKDIASTIRESVEKSFQKLDEKYQNEIHGLKKQLDEPKEFVNYEEIKTYIEQITEDKFNQLPKPKDGEDGKSVTLEDVLPHIQEILKGIEIPKPDISHLEEQVKNAIAEIPSPKDGKDGISPDSDAVAKSMEGIFYKWAIEFERHANQVLEKAIQNIPAPKDGEKGKDGKDAFDLEDVDIQVDEDNRVITLAFVRGDERKEKSIKLNVPLYRDIWKESTYEKGDMVTSGGCLWIALKETSERPVLGCDSWRMVAKKGGTGKSAYDIAREAGFVGTRDQWLESLGKKKQVKLG